MANPHSRIFAIRHVERDKSRTDPQVPTVGGEIAAYAMGQFVREKYHHPKFVDVTSSPQPRATRTAVVFLKGVGGYEWPEKQSVAITTDQRLNDYSTDERPVVKKGVEASKKFGAENGIEVERALFLCDEGFEAVTLKTNEAMALVWDLAEEPGDHLLCGLHGGTIDGMFCRLAQLQSNRLNGRSVPFGTGAAGGLFDKIEGWYVEFSPQGQAITLEPIRRPAYLIAVFR